MSDKLSLSEQQELARLQQEEAALLSQLNPAPEKSAYSDTAKRLALAAGQGVSEATGAAIGQKVGLAAAPWTLGLSVPIGGAIGGVSGYEAFQRASGQEPTWGGRLMAGGLGAIPLGPEARLIGEAGKVTAREVGERALGQGVATLGLAGAAKAVDTGEMLSPTEAAMAMIGGGLGGAASRFATGTAGQDAAGKPLYVAGSKRAARSLQEKTRNLQEDAVLENYRSVGGVSDPMAMNPGFVAETVEGLSGGQRLLNEKLTAVNQEVNTNLARRQLGLSSDQPLSLDTFSSLRSAANQAYERFSELDKLPSVKGAASAAKAGVPMSEDTTLAMTSRNVDFPGRRAAGATESASASAEGAEAARATGQGSAKKALNDLEDARQEMKKSWRIWSNDRAQNKASDPDLLERATNATRRVEKLEDNLEAIAEKAGKPELAQQLKEARKRLAQIHVVESAMTSPLGGQLDSLVIGEINRASPKLLTDNLKLIGDVANVGRQEHIMGIVERPTSSSGRISTPLSVGTAAATYPVRQSILQFASKPGGFYQQGGVPYYPQRAPSGLGLFLRNAPSAAMGTPNQPE